MSKKPILVIDFDGVFHAYTNGWKGADVVTDGPVPGAMRALLALNEHFEVNVYSSRSHQPGGIAAMRAALWVWLAEELNNAEEAFRLTHAMADEDRLRFPTHKPPAMVTIDDRALTFTGNWDDFTVEKLKAFRPWNKGGVPQHFDVVMAHETAKACLAAFDAIENRTFSPEDIHELIDDAKRGCRGILAYTEIVRV